MGDYQPCACLDLTRGPVSLAGLVLSVALLLGAASLGPQASAAAPLYGLCYGQFRSGQSPDLGIHPSRGEIAEDLSHLRRLADRIRVYGSTRSGRIAVQEASRLGFREILAGIWITKDAAANDREIAAGLDLVNRGLPGLTMRISVIVITGFGIVISEYGIVITPRVESRWTAPWVRSS